MNNKFYYDTILTLTKSLIMIYINGVIESSNESIKKVLKKGLDETLNIQDQLFQYLEEDEYYKIENVNNKEVKKLLDKLKKSEA